MIQLLARADMNLLLIKVKTVFLNTTSNLCLSNDYTIEMAHFDR